MYKIGHKIRTLREKHKMSQKELAAELDISQQSVELIENDKNKSITLERLEQIANVFHVPVTDFFEGNNVQTNNNTEKSNINFNHNSPVIQIHSSDGNDDTKEILQKVIGLINKVMEDIDDKRQV